MRVSGELERTLNTRVYTRLTLATIGLAIALLAADSAAADGRERPMSGTLGIVAAAPDFNLGGTLAFYNVLWSIVGMDLSVYGWMTQDGNETTHDVGASLGINAELLLDDLYPSLGVTIIGGQTKRSTVRLQEKECPTYHGEPHCPVVRGQEIDHYDAAWGLEAKLTYVVFDGWLGLTVGYRMPFADPLAGSFVFGAAVVMAPTSFP